MIECFLNARRQRRKKTTRAFSFALRGPRCSRGREYFWSEGAEIRGRVRRYALQLERCGTCDDAIGRWINHIKNPNVDGIRRVHGCGAAAMLDLKAEDAGYTRRIYVYAMAYIGGKNSKTGRLFPEKTAMARNVIALWLKT